MTPPRVLVMPAALQLDALGAPAGEGDGKGRPGRGGLWGWVRAICADTKGEDRRQTVRQLDVPVRMKRMLRARRDSRQHR